MPLQPNPMGTGPNALMFLLSRLFPLSPASNPSAPAEGGFSEVANPALGFGVQNPLLAAAKKPMIGAPNLLASKAALEAFQPDQLDLLGNIARPVVNSAMQAVSKPGLPMYISKTTTPVAGADALSPRPVAPNPPAEPPLMLGAGGRAMSPDEGNMLAAMTRASVTPDPKPVAPTTPDNQPVQEDSQTAALIKLLEKMTTPAAEPPDSTMNKMGMVLEALGKAGMAYVTPPGRAAELLTDSQKSRDQAQQYRYLAQKQDEQNKFALFTALLQNSLAAKRAQAAEAAKTKYATEQSARDQARQIAVNKAKPNADRIPSSEALMRTLQIANELGLLEGNEAKQAGRNTANAFNADLAKKLQGGLPTVTERK